MAIDSASKRKAIAVLSTPWMAVGITPDATPDQFWRQTAGWCYGGILAGAAVGGGSSANLPLLGAACWVLWTILGAYR